MDRPNDVEVMRIIMRRTAIGFRTLINRMQLECLSTNCSKESWIPEAVKQGRSQPEIYTHVIFVSLIIEMNRRWSALLKSLKHTLQRDRTHVGVCKRVCKHTLQLLCRWKLQFMRPRRGTGTQSRLEKETSFSKSGRPQVKMCIGADRVVSVLEIV